MSAARPCLRRTEWEPRGGDRGPPPQCPSVLLVSSMGERRRDYLPRLGPRRGRSVRTLSGVPSYPTPLGADDEQGGHDGRAVRFSGGSVPVTDTERPGRVERYLRDLMHEGPIHFTLIDPDKSPRATAGRVAQGAVAEGSHAILLGGSTGMSPEKMGAAARAVKGS